MSARLAGVFAPSLTRESAANQEHSSKGSVLVWGGRAAQLSKCLGGAYRVDSLRHSEPLKILAPVLFLLPLPGEELELLASATGLLRSPNPPAIGFIAATSSENLAIAALRAGVKGYWPDMPSAETLIDFMRVVRGRNSDGNSESAGMVSTGLHMRSIAGQLKTLAATSATVLITGETGTGKEVAADLIHRASGRKNGPFVAINCAALPEALAESELFGHERGAFTGAFQAQAGRIEQACGGTLLFDEIGDMPLSMQAKLLRTLEQRSVHRLGGRRPIPVDVRFVAATNRPVEELLQQGKFRQDLYYRLAVAKIHLPPLRERPEEIMPLAVHLLDRLNIEYGRSVEGFTAEAVSQLLKYHWPGNVRELRNVVERSLIHVTHGLIDSPDLPSELHAYAATTAPQHDERAELLSALNCTGWNKSEAAKLLNWSRMTLYRKISKYHVA